MVFLFYVLFFYHIISSVWLDFYNGFAELSATKHILELYPRIVVGAISEIFTDPGLSHSKLWLVIIQLVNGLRQEQTKNEWFYILAHAGRPIKNARFTIRLMRIKACQASLGIGD